LARWMRSLRAERGIRPDATIRRARIVAAVAPAWNFEARVPVARARLNAIAAMSVHAPFAENASEGAPRGRHGSLRSRPTPARLAPGPLTPILALNYSAVRCPR